MLSHAALAAVAVHAGVIHYAMIAKGDLAKQTQAMQPVVQYFEEQLGTKIVLDTPKDYKTLIDGCQSGKYDVAHMGGYAYVQVHEQAGWLPLVQGALAHGMHTVFITQTSSDIKTLDDLKGKTFGFGDPNSASDYLMPTYFLDLNNLPARATFKKFSFTRSPIEDVANYRIDAAAVEEVNYKHALKVGMATPAQVRVFYTTPAFPDNLWATRKDFPADLKAKWTRAFLRLTPTNPRDKKILDFFRTPSFITPRNEDYAKVRDAELLEGLLIRPAGAVD